MVNLGRSRITTMCAVIAALAAMTVACGSKEQATCGQSDKPVHLPAFVESWQPLPPGQVFSPQSSGYYFAETASLTCHEGRIEPLSEGTYLRFFADGTVRQNTKLAESGFPQDSTDVMDVLSKDGFDNRRLGSGWGCCSVGAGTYTSAAITIDRFKPAANGGRPQHWAVVDVGTDSFSAVLPYDGGGGGDRYTFRLHSVP